MGGLYMDRRIYQIPIGQNQRKEISSSKQQNRFKIKIENNSSRFSLSSILILFKYIHHFYKDK